MMNRILKLQSTRCAVALARRAAAAGLASLFGPGFAAAAGPGWNESIVGFETHRMVGEPGTGSLWTAEATRSNVFYAGEQVVLHCLTRTTKTNPAKDLPNYTFQFLRLPPGASTPQVLLSSELAVSKMKMDSPAFGATVRMVEIQTLHSTGTYQFGCRILADDDDPKDNGPKWQSVTVLPKQPGLAGLFPVPAPDIVHPVAGQKITPDPSAPLRIKVRVPVAPFGGKPSLIEYAKASVESEKWQLEIVRLGQGMQKGFETTVGKFEGKLEASEFVTDPLSWPWFEKAGGAGRYAARVRFAQIAATSLQQVYAGPSARVEFEIMAPVVLDAKSAAPAHQPVLATGGNRVGAPVGVQRGDPSPTPGREPIEARAPRPATPSDTTRSQLPAVQAAAPVGTPTARAAPNWGALNSPATGAAPPPVMNPRAEPPVATSAASRASAPMGVAGELAAMSCAAGAGGLRFACATRAGFDRCEALRRERKVERCTLGEGR